MPALVARSLAVALALCLACGIAFAEEHRGRPDFKKQSMTRSSPALPTRASAPEMAAAPQTRAGPRPATKAAQSSLGKERMARLNAPTSHRAAKQGTDAQPTGRATGPSARRAGKEAPPATRSAEQQSAKGARKSARIAAHEPPTRSAEATEIRGPRRNSAGIDTARAAKPPYRAPAPDAGLRQDLAARTKPSEPSKRSAHAPTEFLDVRQTRGTWIDWLFGR